MLKRIIRYTLLIACLLIAGVWMRSYWWSDRINYDGSISWGIMTDPGAILVEVDSEPSIPATGLSYFQADAYSQVSDMSGQGFYIELLGFVLYGESGPRGMIVPIWMLWIPLLLVTSGIWYRPLRDRWSKNRMVGFAVQTKQPQPVKD